MKDSAQYEVVIKPGRGWFSFDWQGLWHYRDLLFLLVQREFISKYKQTILGPLWFILQPLLTTAIFVLVFSMGLKVSTDGIPPWLFYLCSLLPWNYFSNSLQRISTSLMTNVSLFNKVYFPRLIIPLSEIFSNLIIFLVQLTIFLVIYFKLAASRGSQIRPNDFLWMLPLLLLQTAAIALGIGLWITAMTVKYRDFYHLVGFFTNLWMYATPIIYPASAVPEKWRFVLALNPMAGIVESYRYAFFGVGQVQGSFLALSAVTTTVVLITGLLVFNQIEQDFVDTI